MRAAGANGLACPYGTSPDPGCNLLFACIRGVWEEADTGVCIVDAGADASTCNQACASACAGDPNCIAACGC